MKTLGLVLLVAVITTFCSNKTAADVVYSTLGPSDTFYTQSGDNIHGTLFTVPQTIGFQFPSQITGTLTTVEVAVFLQNPQSAPGGTGDINVSLHLNNPLTNLPLTGGIFLGSIVVASTIGTLVTITPSLPISLTAGEEYWLVLSPGSNTTQASWCFGFNQGTTFGAFSHDWGQTFTPFGGAASAFRINAAPVPEPSVFALIGIGAILVCRRKRGTIKMHARCSEATRLLLRSL